MSHAYLLVYPSIPFLAMGHVAPHHLPPGLAHAGIALPISIRRSFRPTHPLVRFSQLLPQRHPWLYIDLRPSDFQYSRKLTKRGITGFTI